VNEGYRHRGLVWPILVISAGILLLLNNLGLMEVDLWELLLRGWPLILIAIGIDLLVGRRSIWGSIVAAVLILGVFVLGLGLYQGTIRTGNLPTHTIEQPLAEASSAAIQIDAPVGNLSFSPGAERGMLVDGGVRLLSGSRIEEDFGVAQGEATLSLREVFPTPYIFGRIPDWDLQLGSGVPLALSLDSGVGRATFDLRGLSVETLNVDLGVGLVSVRLPAEGRIKVDVGMGVGQTIIRIPRGMGVRVSADRGLVGLDLPAGFSAGEAGYTSSGYSSATDRVDIKISQGVGLISIRLEE
jgi:hypothetical protein